MSQHLLMQSLITVKARKSVKVSQKKFNDGGRGNLLKITKQKGKNPELCVYARH